MKVGPYPYRARAQWAGATVADSAACLSVEREGAPAVLYFPEADIDLTAFGPRAGGAGANAEGDVELWTGAGDEDGVLAIVTAPAAGLSDLSGHGTFDTDRVVVEVVDGPDPRDAKRFPTWGDTSDLVALMDLHADGPLRYVAGAHTDGRRPVVEGSQMLGQSIVAAMRHAPDRRAVSAHMLFLRGADAAEPLAFALEELSAGRTFTGLSVRVVQHGRLCAAGTVLLDATAPDLVRHGVDAPDVAGPDAGVPCDMGVTGRDIRVIDDAYTNDSSVAPGPPVIDAWVRFRDVGDDPALHAGLLAQFTGHMAIAAGLRPHAGIGQDQAHRTLSMGINAIAISFHRDVRVDEWVLYHHHNTFAGDGMTHADCRAFSEARELVASFSVEAMVRGFPGGHNAHGEKRAL
jgi:acyl-CoA thioesterase/uncharacterized protein (DUF427 family)